MSFKLSIFRFLMSLHASIYDHEAPAARAERMMIVAEAIDDAGARATCAGAAPPDCKAIFGDRRLLLAMVLSKGISESNFAAYVHEGRCHDGPVGARCDEDRFGVARARGPWQQWRMAVRPSSDWDRMSGATLEATRIAAWHAATQLAGGWNSCGMRYPGDKVAGAIAAYAGSCIRMYPAAVQKQADRARKIAQVLRAEPDAS